ncbi:MAG: S41 family peptidase [Bacteroidia bacterium]|nr:S41 family peptidase [Bacteroidia bacterium]
MKRIFVLLFVIFSFLIVNGQKNIQSGKKNIKVSVNGKIQDWSISPEINPDMLQVYCSKEKNMVVFQTNIDTASFSVSPNDTLKFNIVLNNKDTAHTEIIGIKDLPNKISTVEKLYWLSQIWSETKYNFVNIDRFKLNIDSLYKSFIPLAQATKNDYEYYQVLRKFMANLQDGHSQVSDNEQFYPYTDYIPIILQDFNKKVYITSVRKIPELDSTWVGAELIEIENIPTIQYLETRVFPYISASTEQHLWMQGVFKLHSSFKDQPFKGTIKKTNGEIVKIELQRNGEATRTNNDQYWGPQINYSRNIVDLKWLDNDIALVGFNQFSPEDRAIKEFDKVAMELYKAKGVIIDLRKNGGGSTGVAWQLQKYLTNGNFFLNYAWETRTNDGVRKANGNWQKEYKDYFLNRAYRFEKPDSVFVSDTLKRITCPTSILIGRFTFSAAEDFLVNIYETPNRPKLIGEETGGSTGSPLVVPGLPGGGYARICTRRICYPISEKRFVNSGIKPDIEVKQTIIDYLNKKDVVLERAIKEIENAL